MPFVDHNLFEMDCVYTPVGTSDFKSVHMKLHVAKNKMNVDFYANENISIEDLNQIIQNIQRETFNKIKIDIQKECDLFLYVEDTIYKILLEEESTKVKSCVPCVFS